MLCVVRCKMCTNLHIAICVDVLPDFDFYYFQKTSAYEKSKPICGGLGDTDAKTSPKKNRQSCLFGLSLDAGAGPRRGGGGDTWILLFFMAVQPLLPKKRQDKMLPAKTSSAKFSHTTRLTCVNQCDSTPLNLQEPSSFFFEPRFVVLPLLLRRKAQSVMLRPLRPRGVLLK